VHSCTQQTDRFAEAFLLLPEASIWASMLKRGLLVACKVRFYHASALERRSLHCCDTLFGLFRTHGASSGSITGGGIGSGSGGGEDGDDGALLTAARGGSSSSSWARPTRPFSSTRTLSRGPCSPPRAQPTGPWRSSPRDHTRLCGRSPGSSSGVSGGSGGCRSVGSVGGRTDCDAIGGAAGGISNGTGTCLFDLGSDEGEAVDLASVEGGTFASMLARVDELQATIFSPDRGGTDPAACAAALGVYGDNWGPWLP